MNDLFAGISLAASEGNDPLISGGPSTEFEQQKGFAQGFINRGGETTYSNPRTMMVLDDDPFAIRAKRDAASRGLPEPTADYVDKLFVFGKEFSREEASAIPGGRELLDLTERNRRGKKTFLKSLTEDWNPLELVPYVNDVVSGKETITDMVTVRDTFGKMQRGEAVTDEEMMKTRLFMAKAERDSSGTWGATVGSIVRMAPAFAFEMLATAVTGGAAAGASIGTRAGTKALNSTAKKQLSLFVGDALQESLQASATTAGKAFTKDFSRKTAASLSDDAVTAVATAAMGKMRGMVKELPELAGLVDDKAASEMMQNYAKSIAATQVTRAANPSLFTAALDFVSEYGSRALTDHGAHALYAMPTKKAQAVRETLGNFLIEAPLRGALYMAYDQGVMHPIAGALAGNGLGFDSTATSTENQLRAAAMLRGDNDLMNNAKSVSLGMAWMEYASEMTGRGFSMLTGMGKNWAAPMVKAAVANIPESARLQGSALSKLINMEVGNDAALKAKISERALKTVEDAYAKKTVIPGFTDFSKYNSPQEALEKMSGLKQAAFDASIKHEKGIRYFQLMMADKMVNLGMTPEGVTHMFRNMGYDDLVEEILEERYNGFAQGLLGFTAEDHDGAAKHLALMWKGLTPSAEQFTAELVSFSLPSIARTSIFKAQAILGAGNLSLSRDIGEAYQIIATNRNKYILESEKKGETRVGDITPADQDSAAQEVGDAMGRVAATPEKVEEALITFRTGIETLGKLRAQYKEVTPSNIWRRGASSAFGVLNAVISGNPMLAFSDPYTATLKDYGVSARLVSNMGNIYNSLIENQRKAHAIGNATLAGERAALQAPYDAKEADLSREAIGQEVAESYSLIADAFMKLSLSRAGVFVVTDADVKKQVDGIQSRLPGGLTVNGEVKTKEDFINTYRDELAKVLSGKVRAIRSGTNIRFEYFSLTQKQDQDALVSDSNIANSLAEFLGIRDMIEVKSVAHGDAAQLQVNETNPMAASLLKDVAMETDGSPITAKTIELMVARSTNALNELAQGGGSKRLEAFAAEVRMAARTYVNENNQRLKPFHAAFDRKGTVASSYRLAKTDDGKVVVQDAFGPEAIVENGKTFDNEEAANAIISSRREAWNASLAEDRADDTLADFILREPQILFTNHSYIQVQTRWEALAILSKNYRSVLGTRAFDMNDPDYKAKLDAQIREDTLAARYDREFKGIESKEEQLKVYLNGDTDASVSAETAIQQMAEAWEARYGTDGYEKKVKQILLAAGITPKLNSMRPASGAIYQLAVPAISTPDTIYVPYKFMDSLSALMEEATEHSAKGMQGILLDSTKENRDFISPVREMVSHASRLCQAKADQAKDAFKRAVTKEEKSKYSYRAAVFGQLATSIFSRGVNIEAFSKLAVGVAMYRGDMYLLNGSVDTHAQLYSEIGEIAEELRRNPAFPAFASIVDRVRGGIGFTSKEKSADGLIGVISEYRKINDTSNKIYERAKAELREAADKMRMFSTKNPFPTNSAGAEIAYVNQAILAGQVGNVGASSSDVESEKPGSSGYEVLPEASAFPKESNSSLIGIIPPDQAQGVYAAMVELAKVSGTPDADAALKNTMIATGAKSIEATKQAIVGIAKVRFPEEIAAAVNIDDSEGTATTDTWSEGDTDNNEAAANSQDYNAQEFVNNDLTKIFSFVVGMPFAASNGHPVSLKRLLIDATGNLPAKDLDTIVGFLSPQLRSGGITDHPSMKEPASKDYTDWLAVARALVQKHKLPSAKFEPLFAILSTRPRAEKLRLFSRIGSAVALSGMTLNRNADTGEISFVQAAAKAAPGRVYSSLADSLQEQLRKRTVSGWLDKTSEAMKELKIMSRTDEVTKKGHEFLSRMNGSAYDPAKVEKEFFARAQEFAKLIETFFGEGNVLTDALSDIRTVRELLSAKGPANRFKPLVYDFMYTKQTVVVKGVEKTTFYHSNLFQTLKNLHETVAALSKPNVGNPPLNTDVLFAKILGPFTTGIQTHVAQAGHIKDSGAWLRGFGTVINAYAALNPPTIMRLPGDASSKSVFNVQAGISPAALRLMESAEFLEWNKSLPGFGHITADSVEFKRALATGSYVDGTPLIANIAGEYVEDADGRIIEKNEDVPTMKITRSVKKEYEDGNGAYVFMPQYTGDRARYIAIAVPRSATINKETGDQIGFFAFSRMLNVMTLMDRLEPKRLPFMINNGYSEYVPGEVTVAVIANGFGGSAGESTNGMEFWAGALKEIHDMISSEKSSVGKYHLAHPESGESHKCSEAFVDPSSWNESLGDLANWESFADALMTSDTTAGSLALTDMANIKTGYLSAVVSIKGEKMKLIDYILKLHKDNNSDEAAWAPSEKPSSPDAEATLSLADTKVKLSYKGGAVLDEVRLGDILPNIRVVNRNFGTSTSPIPTILYERSKMRIQEAANLHKSARPKLNKIGVNLIKDSIHLYKMGSFLGRLGSASVALARKILSINRMDFLGDEAKETLAAIEAAGFAPGSGVYEQEFAKSAASALRKAVRVKSYGLLALQASSGMRMTGVDEKGKPIIDSLVFSDHEKDMLFMPQAIGPERANLFPGATTVCGLARCNVIDNSQRFLMWAKGDGSALISEFSKEYGKGEFRDIFSRVVVDLVKMEQNPAADTRDLRTRLFNCFTNWDSERNIAFSQKEAYATMISDLTFTDANGNLQFDFTTVFDKNLKELTKANGGTGLAIAGSPMLVSRTPSYNNGSNAAVVRLSTPYSTKADGEIIDDAVIVVDPLTDHRLGTDHDGDKLTCEMLRADKKGRIARNDLKAYSIIDKEGKLVIDVAEAAGNYYTAARIFAVRNPVLTKLDGTQLADGAPVVGTLNTQPVVAEPFDSTSMAALKSTRDEALKSTRDEALKSTRDEALRAAIKRGEGSLFKLDAETGAITLPLRMTDAMWLSMLTGDSCDTATGRGIGVMLVNMYNDARVEKVELTTPSNIELTLALQESADRRAEKSDKKLVDGEEELEIATKAERDEFLYTRLPFVLANVFDKNNSMLRGSFGESIISPTTNKPLFTTQKGAFKLFQGSWALKSKVIDGINNAMFDALKELLAPSMGWNSTGLDLLMSSIAFSAYTTQEEYLMLAQEFVKWYYGAGAKYVNANRYRIGLHDGSGLQLDARGKLLSLQSLFDSKIEKDGTVDEAKTAALKDAIRFFYEGAKVMRIGAPGAIIKGRASREEELAQLVYGQIEEGASAEQAAQSALGVYRLLLTSAALQSSVEAMSPERFSIGNMEEVGRMTDRIKALGASHPLLGIEFPSSSATSPRAEFAKGYTSLAVNSVHQNTLEANMGAVYGPKGLPIGVSEAARKSMRINPTTNTRRSYSKTTEVPPSYSLNISDANVIRTRCSTITNTLGMLQVISEVLGKRGSELVAQLSAEAGIPVYDAEGKIVSVTPVTSNTLSLKLNIEAIMGALADDSIKSVSKFNSAMANIRLPAVGRTNNLATIRAPDAGSSIARMMIDTTSKMLSGKLDKEDGSTKLNVTIPLNEKELALSLTQQEIALLMALYGFSSASDIEMTPNTVLTMFGPELFSQVSAKAVPFSRSMGVAYLLTDFPIQLANGQMFEMIPDVFFAKYDNNQPELGIMLADFLDTDKPDATMRTSTPTALAESIDESSIARQELIERSSRTGMSNSAVDMSEALLEAAADLMSGYHPKSAVGPVKYDKLGEDDVPLREKAFSPAPATSISLYRSILNELIYRVNNTPNPKDITEEAKSHKALVLGEMGAVVSAALDYISYLNIGMKSSEGLVSVDPTILTASAWLAKAAAKLISDKTGNTDAETRLTGRFDSYGVLNVPVAAEEKLIEALALQFTNTGVDTLKGLLAAGPEGKVALQGLMLYIVNMLSPSPMKTMRDDSVGAGIVDAERIAKAAYDKAGVKTETPKTPKEETKTVKEPEVAQAPVSVPVVPKQAALVGGNVVAPVGSVIKNPKPQVVKGFGDLANVFEAVASEPSEVTVPEGGLPIKESVTVAEAAVSGSEGLFEEASKVGTELVEKAKTLVKPGFVPKAGHTSLYRSKILPFDDVARTGTVLADTIDNSLKKNSAIVALSTIRPRLNVEKKGAKYNGVAILNPDIPGGETFKSTRVIEDAVTLSDIYSDPVAVGKALAKKIYDSEYIPKDSKKGFGLSFGAHSFVELRRQATYESEKTGTKVDLDHNALLLYADTIISELKDKGLNNITTFNLSGMNWNLSVAAYRQGVAFTTYGYDKYSPDIKTGSQFTINSSELALEMAEADVPVLAYTVNWQKAAPIFDFTTRVRAWMEIEARKIEDMLPTFDEHGAMLYGGIDHKSERGAQSLEMLSVVRRIFSCLDQRDTTRGMRRKFWDFAQITNFQLLERALSVMGRTGKIAGHLVVDGEVPKVVVAGTELKILANDLDYGKALPTTRGLQLDIETGKPMLVFLAPSATDFKDTLAHPVHATLEATKTTLALTLPSGIARKDSLKIAKLSGANTLIEFNENAGKFLNESDKPGPTNKDFSLVAVTDRPVSVPTNTGALAPDGTPMPTAFNATSNSMLSFMADLDERNEGMDSLYADVGNFSEKERQIIYRLAHKSGFLKSLAIYMQGVGVNVTNLPLAKRSLADLFYISAKTLAGPEADEVLFIERSAGILARLWARHLNPGVDPKKYDLDALETRIKSVVSSRRKAEKDASLIALLAKFLNWLRGWTTSKMDVLEDMFDEIERSLGHTTVGVQRTPRAGTKPLTVFDLAIDTGFNQALKVMGLATSTAGKKWALSGSQAYTLQGMEIYRPEKADPNSLADIDFIVEEAPTSLVQHVINTYDAEYCVTPKMWYNFMGADFDSQTNGKKEVAGIIVPSADTRVEEIYSSGTMFITEGERQMYGVDPKATYVRGFSVFSNDTNERLGDYKYTKFADGRVVQSWTGAAEHKPACIDLIHGPKQVRLHTEANFGMEKVPVMTYVTGFAAKLMQARLKDFEDYELLNATSYNGIDLMSISMDSLYTEAEWAEMLRELKKVVDAYSGPAGSISLRFQAISEFMRANGIRFNPNEFSDHGVVLVSKIAAYNSGATSTFESGDDMALIREATSALKEMGEDGVPVHVRGMALSAYSFKPGQKPLRPGFHWMIRPRPSSMIFASPTDVMSTVGGNLAAGMPKTPIDVYNLQNLKPSIASALKERSVNPDEATTGVVWHDEFGVYGTLSEMILVNINEDGSYFVADHPVYNELRDAALNPETGMFWRGFSPEAVVADYKTMAPQKAAAADESAPGVTTSFDNDGLPTQRAFNATSNSMIELAFLKESINGEVTSIIEDELTANPGQPLWMNIFKRIDQVYTDRGLSIERNDATEHLAAALKKYYENQTSFLDTDIEDTRRQENFAMSMAGAIMRLSRGYGWDSYDHVAGKLEDELNRAKSTGDGVMITVADAAFSVKRIIEEYGFGGSELEMVDDELDRIEAMGDRSSKPDEANPLKDLVKYTVDTLRLLMYYKFHASQGTLAAPAQPWNGALTIEANTPEEDVVLGSVSCGLNLTPVHTSIQFKIADYESWYNSLIRPTFNGSSVREIMQDGSIKAYMSGFFDDLHFLQNRFLGNENGELQVEEEGTSELGADEGKIVSRKSFKSKYTVHKRVETRKGGHFTTIRFNREFKNASNEVIENSKALMHFVMSCIDNLYTTVHDTGRKQSVMTGLKMNFGDFKERHMQDFAEVLHKPDELRARLAKFFSAEAIEKRRSGADGSKKRLDLDVAFDRIHEYVPICQHVGKGIDGKEGSRSLEQLLRDKILDLAYQSLYYAEQQQVAEDLYKDGWIAKQTITDKGTKKYVNWVLTIPMEIIEEIFDNSEARKTLLSAGRQEKDLSLQAMADQIRPLMARLHRISSDLPWIRDGIGAGLTAASASAPFFRGSAQRDYQDRNTDLLERRLPSVEQQLSEENESMLRTVAAAITAEVGERGMETSVKGLEDAPKRMVRFFVDLVGLAHAETDFVDRVKDGEFESGAHGFVLRKDANMVDLAAVIYAKSIEKVYTPQESTDGRKVTAISGLPLDTFNRMYEAALQSSDFKNGIPGLTAYQAYERDGALPAGNYTVLDRIQLYANELMGAEELRGTMTQMLMSTDDYGNPRYLANPSEGMGDNDALPDEMWGVLARWWSSSFSLDYHMDETGRENARRIFGLMAARQKFQGSSKVQYVDGLEVTGYHHLTETGLASISGFLCRLDEPFDDTKAWLNNTCKGEAAGMMAQLLKAKKSVHTSSFSHVVDSMLSWSKANSVMGSVFFTIATAFESPLAAVGPSYWKMFNKDPEFVSMKDILKLIGSNDPFFRRLKMLAILQGIPLSDRTKNPIEHFNKGQVDRDIRAITARVRATMGNKAADNLNAVLKGALQSSGEFAFEYLINATTLAVMAKLNNRFRQEAIAKGIGWDPIYSMRKWSTYISAEVGGGNPVVMPFMTPKMQMLLSWGMFSWPWTIGAWMAGGGDVLTQKIMGMTSNPAVRGFMYGRWLRMAGLVMYGIPFLVQLVSTAIGKALGDEDDDAWWLTSSNEDKQKLKSADITPVLKAISKLPGVKGFKASGGDIDALPDAANTLIKPATWLLAKFMPAYTGTDATNTTGQRRIYFHLGKQGWEVLSWFDNTWGQTVSKMSMPLQKFLDGFLGFNLGSGYKMDWAEQSLGERLVTIRGNSAWKHFMSSFVPFSFQGMMDKGDVGMLGMVGPTSYGVGQSASIANMKGILDRFADPAEYRAVYSNKNTYNDLYSRVRDEMNDAKRNGLDPENMLRSALGQAREPYYRKVYDALPKTPHEEPDNEALESAMRSLYRLWFTEKNLVKSVKTRFDKTNNDLNKMPAELKGRIYKAMGEAMANPTGEEEAQRAVRRAERGGDVAPIVRELATDALPPTVLGYKIVGPEDLSPEDIGFFENNPEAAGYYSMDGDDPDDTPPGSGRRALKEGGDTNSAVANAYTSSKDAVFHSGEHSLNLVDESQTQIKEMGESVVDRSSVTRVALPKDSKKGAYVSTIPMAPREVATTDANAKNPLVQAHEASHLYDPLISYANKDATGERVPFPNDPTRSLRPELELPAMLSSTAKAMAEGARIPAPSVDAAPYQRAIEAWVQENGPKFVKGVNTGNDKIIASWMGQLRDKETPLYKKYINLQESLAGAQSKLDSKKAAPLSEKAPSRTMSTLPKNKKFIDKPKQGVK